jgi:hypothetical protein
MQESPVVQKLEILPANPLFLRMAGFQAPIDGWFSAPTDTYIRSELRRIDEEKGVPNAE